MPNLAQVSETRGSELGREALGTLLEASRLLSFLDQQAAFEEDATDYQWRTYEDEEGVQTRQRGGSYTPEDVAPGAPESDTLSFHGDKIDVDHSDHADSERGLRDIAMWLAKTMRKKVRRFGRGWEQVATGGSADPGAMKGLEEILDGVANVAGFGQTMVIDAASWTEADDDHFDLGDETLWGLFIEQLIKVLSELDANGLLVAPALHARMYTIAQEKHILGESRDQFGNPVPTFANIPFVPLNPGAITTTEDNNASPAQATTTSLYPVRAGEGQLSLVTNSGLEFWDLGDLEGKESNRVKWELRGQWKIEEEHAARRIRNIKL